MSPVIRLEGGRTARLAGKTLRRRRVSHRVWTALTGTPGSGKSVIGRRLKRRWDVMEVGSWARQLGCAPARRTRTLVVDLDCVARAMRQVRAPSRPVDTRRTSILVGHLSHLLPVRDIIVLRCHPRQLKRRLAGRRLSSSELHANLASEATDLILTEALKSQRPGRLWEVDTTGRSPATVAQLVEQLLRRRPRSSFGGVDWLADPWVTEELLRDAP